MIKIYINILKYFVTKLIFAILFKCEISLFFKFRDIKSKWSIKMQNF